MEDGWELVRRELLLQVHRSTFYELERIVEGPGDEDLAPLRKKRERDPSTLTDERIQDKRAWPLAQARIMQRAENEQIDLCEVR